MEKLNFIKIFFLFLRFMYFWNKNLMCLLFVLLISLLLASSVSAASISAHEESNMDYESQKTYPELAEYPMPEYSSNVHMEENSDSLIYDLEELSKILVNDKKETKNSAFKGRTPNFKGTVDYEYFSVMLPHVTSSYDFLRIQFGHWLSDEEISDYLSSLLDATNSANPGIWPENVDKQRKERGQTIWSDLDSMNRALDGPYDRLHHLRKHGVCGEPSRKVFRVSHFYPNSKVIYVPSEVLLHRCDSHSGCCENVNFTCVVAEKKIIRQTFYTVDLLPRFTEVTEQQIRIDPMQIITKLYFINHTRCECKETTLPTLSTPPTPLPTNTLTHIEHKNFMETQSCMPCPEPFTLRYRNSTCLCDCFDGETDCIHVKRGKKQLDGNELKCIQNKQCHRPICDVGEFDDQTGFCPKSQKRQKKKKTEIKLFNSSN